MWLLDRLRARLQSVLVLPDERCSYCPQRAVVFESAIVGNRTVRDARCADHPPDTLKDLDPCGVCGRPFWPDFMHLDCP